MAAVAGDTGINNIAGEASMATSGVSAGAQAVCGA